MEEHQLRLLDNTEMDKGDVDSLDTWIILLQEGFDVGI